MTTDEMICDLAYGSTRDDAAKLYAAAIRYGWMIDWPRLNAALISSWSESGLRYIKRQAWKINESLGVSR